MSGLPEKREAGAASIAHVVSLVGDLPLGVGPFPHSATVLALARFGLACLHPTDEEIRAACLAFLRHVLSEDEGARADMEKDWAAPEPSFEVRAVMGAMRAALASFARAGA